MGVSRRGGLVLAALLGGQAAPAAADSTRAHLFPDGPTESCQLLVPFPFTPADVSGPDARSYYRTEDFQAVDALCAIDLHAESSTAATAVGVCPKIHGTMPGLEIYDLAGTGLSKAQFESLRCKVPGRIGGGGGKPRKATKLAKFKISVFSSENQSMLLYFHFSRLLGNLAHVQPATYRTVAVSDYRRWAADAIDRLKQRGTTTFSPLDGWEITSRLLSPRTKLRPRIVAARKKIMVDDELLFGTIVDNPRGERERRALCLRGKKSLGQPETFREFAFYRLVASRRPLSQHRVELQTLACARDYTDMIILDHVFNQIDRMGNIHQKTYYHAVDDQGRLTWTGKPAPGAVPLARLVLKDNDDGLKWKVRSRIVALRLVDDIRHLDPTVYARIQWLAGLMAEPASNAEVRTWFVSSVHVAPAHYDQVRTRFLDLAARFKDRHDRGQLHLDLDLAAAMTTLHPPSSSRSAAAAPPAR